MLRARTRISDAITALRSFSHGPSRLTHLHTEFRSPPVHRLISVRARRFAQDTKCRQDVASLVQPGSYEVAEVMQRDAAFAKSLPTVCPGCGAFSQTLDTDAPGYYAPSKKSTKIGEQDEQSIYEAAMAKLALESDAALGTSVKSAATAQLVGNSVAPICRRCHELVHQSKGHSIVHPSMQSIQSIIESSPHKHNHIYHVVDAADFPMSLIPNLVSALDLPRLRTQNRRSKSVRYARDRVADISFIITRSDLLAPQKEQVDKLMPYLQEVLRDALGRSGRSVRLGNVRCVSAKRGWWTPVVKQEIWNRGGAGWVVGKVNVGKSALFEVVFPKGRSLDVKQVAKLDEVRAASAPTLRQDEKHALQHHDTPPQFAALETQYRKDDLANILEHDHSEETEDLSIEDGDEASLLPPAQPETMYPHMPIVSALPGTTASPIRIPFGGGKGELIDLPGVHRTSLDTHVRPELRSALIMKSRVVPEQYTIKPGQSLLLGGLIRITPKTDDLIFLAYPFTPLRAHVTSNEKATAIQTGKQEDGSQYDGTVQNIGTDTAKTRIQSAGLFKINWDATNKRTGSLTDSSAGKRKVADLPFIVYSADILIEGVGWVELACQVRKRGQQSTHDVFGGNRDASSVEQSAFPEIEVFTPKGKFIGIRRPMNAWSFTGPRKPAAHMMKSRPRETISMQRRRAGGSLAPITPQAND